MSVVGDYTDKMPMPFGKHKGISLANVPAEYLIWLWETSQNGEKMYDRKLALYIKNNLEALKLEVIAHKQQKRYEKR